MTHLKKYATNKNGSKVYLCKVTKKYITTTANGAFYLEKGLRFVGDGTLTGLPLCPTPNSLYARGKEQRETGKEGEKEDREEQDKTG